MELLCGTRFWEGALVVVVNCPIFFVCMLKRPEGLAPMFRLFEAEFVTDLVDASDQVAEFLFCGPAGGLA